MIDDNNDDSDNNYSTITFKEEAQLAVTVFNGAIMKAKKSDRFFSFQIFTVIKSASSRRSFFRATRSEQK